MRRFCLSSHSLMAENCWGDVIIIHPSARDWKLFMYENNDVRRKKFSFGKRSSARGKCVGCEVVSGVVRKFQDESFR